MSTILGDSSRENILPFFFEEVGTLSFSYKIRPVSKKYVWKLVQRLMRLLRLHVFMDISYYSCVFFKQKLMLHG